MDSRVKNILSKTEYAVFFGGAGMSTESGIPDFRSVDGLYNQKYKFPPETMLSHSFFLRHTKDFYDFYRDKLDCRNAEPNAAHYALAELEKSGVLKCVITQNIDGLHTKAGSENVIEIHGTIHKNTCIKCGKKFDADFVFSSTDIPRCDCGGCIKPDVVLYEESLNNNDMMSSINHISKADTLIVAGTSLTVYPAAGLLRYFRGRNLILINRDSTPYDDEATLVIHDSVGKILGN